MTKTERKIYHKNYYQVNKDKMDKQHAQWYKDNKEQYKDHRKVYRKNNCEQLANKAKQSQLARRHTWYVFINAKEMACQICGFNKAFVALDFHHRDSTKRNMVYHNL